ncbi:hypothetical protein N5J07_14235 [Comamonas aquatica]|uniref:hypothetical protein n=1 Tax=Comamonas aquatica TaxID=225991 RepID=UPI0024474448|nr:hypothetical protein [Comamonas aquatica]MDH1380585.1 hypothetical protein [Comamonas aquatica]MDH1640505.1 hypothetical protein [Comamonas aquatica]
MFAKFLLGKIKIEDSVRHVTGREPLDLIARHAVCEHGIASPRRHKQNLLALAEAGEIQSEYLVNPLDPSAGTVLVTTTAGWGETCVTMKKQPRTTRKKKDPDDLPI